MDHGGREGLLGWFRQRKFSSKLCDTLKAYLGEEKIEFQEVGYINCLLSVASLTHFTSNKTQNDVILQKRRIYVMTDRT